MGRSPLRTSELQRIVKVRLRRLRDYNLFHFPGISVNSVKMFIFALVYLSSLAFFQSAFVSCEVTQSHLVKYDWNLTQVSRVTVESAKI